MLKPLSYRLSRRHLANFRSQTRPGRPTLPTATWSPQSIVFTTVDRLAKAPVVFPGDPMRWSAMRGRGRGVRSTGPNGRILEIGTGWEADFRSNNKSLEGFGLRKMYLLQ